MEIREIRLACLKLAVASNRELEVQLKTAERFTEFVTGEEAKVPERVSQVVQPKTQKKHTGNPSILD